MFRLAVGTVVVLNVVGLVLLYTNTAGGKGGGGEGEGGLVRGLIFHFRALFGCRSLPFCVTVIHIK